MQNSLKLYSLILATALVGCSSPLQLPEIKPVVNYEASVVSNVAGSVQGYWDGPAAEAKFLSIRGIAIDASGSIFVTDLGSVGPTPYYRIRKIDPAGNVTTLAGSTMGETNGPVAQARFSVPIGIAVAGDRLYISDSNNNRIRLITAESTASTLAGGVQGYADGPAHEARFFLPMDVAADSNGNVYVGEQSNVRKIGPDGTVSTLVGGPNAMLNSPSGSPKGGMYVSTRGLGVDSQGNVLVAGSSQGILRITPAGEVSKVAGPADDRGGHVDGPADQARFEMAEDVAADQAGNVYVADGGSVRRISPQGIVTTIAGGAGDGTKLTEGEGSKVRFGHISSIAVDASGSLIVAHGSRLSRIRLP